MVPGTLVGFEQVQMRDDEGELVLGALRIEDDGSVHFQPVPESTEKAAAPEGSYGDAEETGTPPS